MIINAAAGYLKKEQGASSTISITDVAARGSKSHPSFYKLANSSRYKLIRKYLHTHSLDLGTKGCIWYSTYIIRVNLSNQPNMVLAACESISTFLSPLALLAFTLATLIIPIIYWLGTGRYSVLKSLNLPGPKPLPFVGHLFDLAKYKYNYHLMIDTYYKDFGRVFGMYLQSTPTIVVSDPEMIKQILVKDFAKFHDRQASSAQ